jgi:phthiocerol/phenolphthiocerol synthesis type-I polyketide synthase B
MSICSASQKANDMAPDPARSVAIIGMACRFPGGAHTPDAYWKMLCEGRDAVGDIPQSRMDVDRLYAPTPATPGRIMTRFGGYLEGIDQFDAGFFHISPREAERMDPQQRLLLETAWEAIEDAGLDAGSLAGRSVGVYVGQWLSDFEMRLLSDPTVTDFEMTTGSGRYTTSGRLSHFLNLMGPSLTLDTACSSSLTAVHLAMQSLRLGESELAFAAGVNVILSPHITVGYSQSRMMAPDGRCKFGDAAGDGYVRSEGAGLVLLKRLDRALADGDRIHAVIRGSAINNDGSSSGSFGTPSRSGQEALLRQALIDADLPAACVGYVEAHGTGTRSGDPVELGAVSTVLGAGRSTPLRVGSVKSNIGHTEGAAGMAGLIKAALAVNRARVPASLHFNNPNPDIDWDSAPLEIARQTEPWDTPDRIAGVSGFGIAGSNAHLLVQNPPPVAEAIVVPAEGVRPAILPISADSLHALRELAGSYAHLLQTETEISVHAVCAAAAHTRTPLTHRVAIIGHCRDDMIEALARFRDGDDHAVQGQVWSDTPAAVAFVAPGQGGQWAGMARSLIESEPVFRLSIEACEQALEPLVNWSLSEQIQLETGADGYRLDEIAVIQPVLVALAISYAQLWRAMGVAPTLTIGHSMGEVSAAAVSGSLSLQDAMRVVVARSALMARTSGEGGMALVELSGADIEAVLAPYRGRLSVAAVNSPRASVISGDVSALDAVLESLSSDGIFCRKINVDVASHGPQMAALAPELASVLHDVSPKETRVPMLSTVTGSALPGQHCDGNYWARNLREPVRFIDAVEAALKTGVNAFVELGPNPVLLTSIEQTLSHHDADAVLVASERRDSPAMDIIAEGLAKLWTHGCDIDWHAYAGAPRRDVTLPLYPWQRSRHWHEAAEETSTNKTRKRAHLPEETKAMLHHLAFKQVADLETASAQGQDWLLISPETKDSNVLTAALEAIGARVDCANGETAQDVFSSGKPYHGIIVMAPGEGAAFLPVKLLQLLRQNSIAAQQIMILTQGASSAGGPRQRVSIDQASMTGALRVIGDEHPEFRFRLIDADPDLAFADQAPALANQVLGEGAEPESAYRKGNWFVPRLRPLAGIVDRNADFELKTDAAYLITGGLSALGLRAASVLASAGAHHIILLSRRPLAPRQQWKQFAEGTDEAKRIAGVIALESAGVSVEIAALDIADHGALQAFLAAREMEMRPSVKGVFHLATAYDTRLAADTDQHVFNTAIAPKLDGARVLDREFPDVDMFVLYSSTMTFVPHQGLAAYAAANCGLDALAADRQARGQAATSIAWGPWKQLGRAALDHVADEFEARGELAMEAIEGDSLLTWIIGQSAPVLSAFRMDWSIFRKSRQGRALELFEELFADGVATPTDGAAFESLSLADRRTAAKTFVSATVTKVLKLRPEDFDLNRPLGDLGLNSLMGIELRNALEKCVGRPLPATLAWTYPTSSAIIEYLSAGALEAPADNAAPIARTSESPDDLDASLSAIDDLSDAEALAALLGGRK